MLGEDGGCGFHGGVFRPATRGSVVEPPPGSTPADLYRHVLVVLKPCGGQDAAVVGAARPRAVLVDGAAAVYKHRTVPSCVVAEHDVSVRESRGRREKLGRDVGEGVVLVGGDVDELRRRAARRALSAGDVGNTAAADGAAHVPEPARKVAGRKVDRHASQSDDVPTGSEVDAASAGAATNGRANVSVVPPGSLVAQMRPPCASTMRLQM